jgi:2,3-dimethylmalate lyase
MNRHAQLRETLDQSRITLMPGVYDAMSARLAEQVGFKVLNVGGAFVANSIIGMPDIGLVTLSEMAEQIRRVAAVTTVPLIADADTGYGNAINVMRTVREYERAGASGMYIEDQVFPKRCGHFQGKEVISAAEMVSKLMGAAEAREDDDFLIIARTDARAVHGFDDALYRSNLFLEAGADMVFFEAPESTEELARVPKEVNGPCMANMVSGGITPLTKVEDLADMGYKLANFGGAALQAAMFAVLNLYQELIETGTSAGHFDRMMSFGERQDRLGLPEMDAIEARLVAASEALVAASAR